MRLVDDMPVCGVCGGVCAVHGGLRSDDCGDAGCTGCGFLELCWFLCRDGGGRWADAATGRGVDISRAGEHGGRGTCRRDVSGRR